MSTGDVENAAVVKLVSAGVSAMLARLHSKLYKVADTKARLLLTSPLPDLAEFEDGSSKVSVLVSEAANIENICRMDPAWNPWM